MPLSAALLSAAIPFSFVATLAIHRSLLCCSSTALLSIAALQSFSFQALSLAVLMLAFLSPMWPSALLTDRCEAMLMSTTLGFVALCDAFALWLTASSLAAQQFSYVPSPPLATLVAAARFASQFSAL